MEGRFSALMGASLSVTSPALQPVQKLATLITTSATLQRQLAFSQTLESLGLVVRAPVDPATKQQASQTKTR
jgi:Rad3-related DNA helicase